MTWLSEETWVELCREATGLTLLSAYYRPPGRPRSEQPFLATVWQKEGAGGVEAAPPAGEG